MWYLGGPLEFYRIDPIMEIKFPGENCLRKQFSMKSRNFSKSRFPGKKAAVGFVKQLKISGPEFPVNATGRCYRIKYYIGPWLWSTAPGAVGRAVASDIRDPSFESKHQQSFLKISVCICQLQFRKDE